jgi:GR25 family glycosyltransferase involved in LPS biosynthesis
MKLNDYFDKIYCINLDRRTDRWEECQKIFKKLEIEVERFSAVDGKLLTLPHGNVYNAELAGSMSHTEIIKMAKEKGYKNILILEDDIEFKPELNTLFEEYIKQVPTDWDILFFGGNHVGGANIINTNVQRLFRSYAIHAYGVSKAAYDVIIHYMESKIEKVKTTPEKLNPSVAADYFMADLHRNLNVYGFRPHLAWQRTGYSDIQEAVMNYDFLKK